MKGILVAILALSACAAWAQSDVRTRALDTKAGLDKQITLTMRAATLREALDEISTQTGVKLRPDREVSDDKCTISVKEKSARDVLRAIAKCFNLCWVESEVGSSQYLSLCTDKEYRKSMAQKQYEDYTAIIGQIDDEAKTVSDAIKADAPLKYSEEDTKGLPEDQISRMYFRQMFTGDKTYGSMVLQYRRLTEGQKKDLFAGKEVTIPKESICQEAREAYPEATSYTFWIVASLNGYLLQGTVQPQLQPHDWTLITMAIFEDSRYDKTIDDANTLLAKDADLAKDLPKPKPVEAPAAPTEQPPADKSLEEQASSIFGPNILQSVPRPGEGSGATPTTMSDGLLELSEATGIPVVAQYLSEYAPNGASAPKAGRIVDRLGGLSKTHKFTVERDGGFLLAHSLLWHRLRDREVSETAIRRWQKAITGLPLPTFDVSVEMANTSWAQVRGIIANRARWFGMGDLSMIASSEYALKMYASLTAAQQRRLGDGRPVMVSDLKPAQWQTFMQAFEMKARPSYVKAQTPSWPQVSSVSLEPASFAGAPLVAVWNMRFVGSENVGEHVPRPDPAQSDQTQTEVPSGEMIPAPILDRQARLAAFQAAVPVAASALIKRITTEHPEIPRKEIRVYGMYQVTFIFQIGDTKQEVRLWCSMPVQ